MFRHALTLLIVLALAGGICRAENGANLDWTAWRHMPVFGEGRVVPLETFARESVETICGRTDPTLILPGAPPHKFDAVELLFDWLAEPQKWQNVSFLPAEDEQLRRDVLALPIRDEAGRRLCYASPDVVENSRELGIRLDDLERRAASEGKRFRLAGVDQQIKALVDGYGKFRLLTFNLDASKDVPRRFYARVRLAANAWRKLAGDLQSSQRIARDDETRRLMVAAGESLQKLIGQVHGVDFSREKVEPTVVAFCRAGRQLAERLADANDKPLNALAGELRRQTEELHLAMYQSGESLCLVPALSAGALDEDRTPEDDAAPWLSFQAMILGSDELLRQYPQAELKAVRKAWAEVKAAYLAAQGGQFHFRGEQFGSLTNVDSAAKIGTVPGNAADCSERFSAAMNRFADAVRTLGQRIEPLRQDLPIQHRDQDLIDSTAYPPPGSTDLEVLYNRLDPFFWSWAISLAAMFCLLLAVGRARQPMFWLGVATLLAAQAFTAAGMGLRGYITGLVPLTGMFETVVFVALYAALLGLWFALKPLGTREKGKAERGKRKAESGRKRGTWNAELQRSVPAIHHFLPLSAFRFPLFAFRPSRPSVLPRMEQVFQRRPFALAGAVVSFIAMALAYYAPASVMHQNIGSIAPILRDNFWLAVHVVTIMASYASAAIALILGNVALGYYLFGRYVGRRPPPACKTLAGFTYTAIKITVLLLAAGTILGALWADKAWGRFWAWDPKEVWALVSLLVYLGFLHARHIGWSGDFGMALMGVLGAGAILCTWYGVNFLMGSGMHSYGFGAGGQWQVGLAVTLQGLFVLAAGVRYGIGTGGGV